MLGKKLLTLACAAGLLVLGACFLPPLPVRQPPPAPPRIDFHGIRRLCVTVSGKSRSRRLSVRDLAANIAEDVNQRVDKHILRASAACRPSDNGTLQVDILSESAAQQANSASSVTPRWSAAVALNATLTDRAGTVIWHAANFQFSYPFPIVAPDAETMWSTAEGRIRYVLGNRLVTRLLNGD
jgi:hypothetical protein